MPNVLEKYWIKNKIITIYRPLYMKFKNENKIMYIKWWNVFPSNSLDDSNSPDTYESLFTTRVTAMKYKAVLYSWRCYSRVNFKRLTSTLVSIDTFLFLTSFNNYFQIMLTCFILLFFLNINIDMYQANVPEDTSTTINTR